MLNLNGMLRAPALYKWEVSMDRKRSGDAMQNLRRRVAYISAPNESEAKRLAGLQHPEFMAVVARRAS